VFHLVAVHGAASGPASHETDRARFIGRGRGLHAPAAMRGAAPLSGTSGSVLDPVAATRRVITLEPDQTALVDIVYGAADSREACLALAHKMMDRRLADRVFELAWTHSQVILRQLNASEADAQTYARLANTVVYSQPTLRADAQMLPRNRRGQSGLWGYGISGDLPIVLLQISDVGSLDLVFQMVQAHAWWRLKGLAVDLVIWNEERDIYRQRLQEQILGLISSSIESQWWTDRAASSCGTPNTSPGRIACCCRRWPGQSSATASARLRSRWGPGVWLTAGRRHWRPRARQSPPW
jgi:cellobiose phosphorylase